mgnify:CR=1 FL=1
MFRVSDAEVPEVEAILATSHEKWMRATHQRPAESSPLVYTISKASELKNPLDPSESVIGHTMMALTEVYRGLEGSQAHMESSAGWQDIGVMLEKVIANYSMGNDHAWRSGWEYSRLDCLRTLFNMCLKTIDSHKPRRFLC